MPFALIFLAAAAAVSGPVRWTFCVAESGHEIWITGVFLASDSREKIETQFIAELSAQGVARPVAQCPEPHLDKTDALNAQFTATEFHRKLGDALHAVAAPHGR